MRVLVILAALAVATPAAAHHEAATVSLLPHLMVAAATASVAGMALWRRWIKRRKE